VSGVRYVEPMPTTEDLAAELAQLAGSGTFDWPGLHVCQFSAPTQTVWNDVGSLGVGIVAHGSRAVALSGRRLQFASHTLEATPERPCWCLVLRIDPRLVRRLWSRMARGQPRLPPLIGDDVDCAVADLDDDLLRSILRFVRSLASESDRRVLSPLYLEETVYRLLQSEQSAPLARFAVQQTQGPVAQTLDYIDGNLAEPLSVTGLARRVSLSPSALSRAFRENTGRSPYQYVKEARLTRARDLLSGGRHGIGEVAYDVGYTSVSHFIKEFRTRFGATPGEYAESFNRRRRMHHPSIA
jgi:AraC-like DNA-binding protein